MRKVMSFLLIFVITMSLGAPVFATMEEKLGNHWSKKMIDKDFLLYYFPYLAKEDFKRFNPNEPVYEDEFLLSFSSLLKDNGYSNGLIGWKRELTRAEMSKIVGKKMMEVNLIKSSNKKLPFTDINDLSQEEQKIIDALCQAGIIKGQSNTIYNPKRNVTQAEAVIVLQRVETLLDKVSSIPFKLSGVVGAYSGKEGVTSKSEGENLLVTITKEFPTPGYSMKVEKIARDKGEYKVYLDITPPSKESIQLQVITYKTITIAIDKKDIGNPPYKFVLEDF